MTTNMSSRNPPRNPNVSNKETKPVRKHTYKIDGPITVVVKPVGTAFKVAWYTRKKYAKRADSNGDGNVLIECNLVHSLNEAKDRDNFDIVVKTFQKQCKGCPLHTIGYCPLHRRHV